VWDRKKTTRETRKNQKYKENIRYDCQGTPLPPPLKEMKETKQRERQSQKKKM
jgi:hypothetical protein